MTNREILVRQFERLQKDGNGFIKAEEWEKYRYLLAWFTDGAEVLDPKAEDSPVHLRLEDGGELTVVNPGQLEAAAYLE